MATGQRSNELRTIGEPPTSMHTIISRAIPPPGCEHKCIANAPNKELWSHIPLFLFYSSLRSWPQTNFPKAGSVKRARAVACREPAAWTCLECNTSASRYNYTTDLMEYFGIQRWFWLVSSKKIEQAKKKSGSVELSTGNAVNHEGEFLINKRYSGKSSAYFNKTSISAKSFFSACL